MDNCFRITGDFLYINIKVIPGAARSGIIEVKDNKLKIRIAAEAEHGKANEELRSFIAKTLGIPKKDITLASGEKSRQKILRLPVSAKVKLEEIIG